MSQKDIVLNGTLDSRERDFPIVLADLASQWIAFDGRGRIVADASLNVVWINATAVRLLTNDSAISVVGTRIADGPGRVAIKNLHAHVDTGVARAIVPFAKGNGNYLMNAYRLTQGSPYFCIEIQVDCDDVKPSYADFGHVFRLTRTEIEIVEHMLDGLNVTEIAHERVVAVDTIRSHVRGVYEKVGVTSREQLFSRLRRFQVL